MATAKDFVRKAASQIGTKESPAGSNRVKYAKWYGLNGQPWCDMYVSWCANEVDALDVVGKYAYTPSHANFFKKGKNGSKWLGRTSQPKTGDIVFFSNGTRICHVGIVEKRLSSTSVQTIEGNTSLSNNDNGGRVMRRKRSYSKVGGKWYIAGFGRPKWDSATSSAPKKDAKPTSKPKPTEKGDEVYSFATVKKGTKGNTVKLLQAALNVRNGSKLSVDGECGSNTVSAIKSWQKRRKLSVDGICGVKTWDSLLSK